METATQAATLALMSAIAARESERRALEQLLWGSGPGSVQAAIAEVREFALFQLGQVRDALQAQSEAARFELARHVEGIVLHPTARGDERFYVAEGEWSLLGKYEGRPPGTALRNLEMVAGVRFEQPDDLRPRVPVGFRDSPEKSQPDSSGSSPRPTKRPGA